RAPSFENATDGAHRGHRRGASCRQLVVDRSSAVLTQITRLLQLATQDQHGIFYRGIRSTRPSGDRGMVAPIDLLQGPLPRSPQPPLHGSQAHFLSPRHRPHRGAVPNRGHHGAPPALLAPGSFYSSHLPFHTFPPSIATEKYWHLG